jgi:glucose-1-phosphate adenylyltransferase
MKDVLAVVLAGGKGSRLEPLTRDRAKPAVPFGGVYRIIDFTLSNCLNSGIRKILVLTQYKAMSLARHVTNGWRHLLCRVPGHRRRRLPEHLHAGAGAAEVRRHPRRRPHLQDGLQQDGRLPRGDQG